MEKLSCVTGSIIGLVCRSASASPSIDSIWRDGATLAVPQQAASSPLAQRLSGAQALRLPAQEARNRSEVSGQACPARPALPGPFRTLLLFRRGLAAVNRHGGESRIRLR